MYKSNIKIQNPKPKNQKIEKGVSIYLVILISTFILAIALGLSALLIPRIEIGREISYSIVAFYAADSGIEKVLTEKQSPLPSYDGFVDLNGNSIQDSEDAVYHVDVFTPGPECTALNFCLRSIGSYKGVRRAIEANY